MFFSRSFLYEFFSNSLETGAINSNPEAFLTRVPLAADPCPRRNSVTWRFMGDVMATSQTRLGLMCQLLPVSELRVAAAALHPKWPCLCL